MPVPEVIARIRSYLCSSAFADRYSERILASLDRLLSHEEVYPVWEGMALDADRLLPELFIDACAHAMWTWERMPVTSDKEILTVLSKLAGAAASLADELDRHGEIIAFAQIRIVINSYSAAPSLKNGNQGSDSDAVAPATLVRAEVPEETVPGTHARERYIDDFAGPTSVQSLLRELAQRLAASPMPWLPELRPRKRQAKFAERTFLVKTLVQFFIAHGGNPRWDWVARAVSAMTDTDDLDVRHVQLLCEATDVNMVAEADDYRPVEDKL